jgi:hypothetical protein
MLHSSNLDSDFSGRIWAYFVKRFAVSTLVKMEIIFFLDVTLYKSATSLSRLGGKLRELGQQFRYLKDKS